MVSHILLLLMLIFIVNVYYFYNYFLPQKNTKKVNIKSKVEYFQSFEKNI